MKITLFLSFLFILQISFAQSYTISVNITGMQGSGTVYVQLFEEGQKFKADSKDCRVESVHLENGPGQVRFSPVEKGNYAIMIYHDENDNGILDTNMIGMPKEGVGTSNNHKGIPSFKKCYFVVESNTTIEIGLVYLK